MYLKVEVHRLLQVESFRETLESQGISGISNHSQLNLHEAASSACSECSHGCGEWFYSDQSSKLGLSREAIRIFLVFDRFKIFLATQFLTVHTTCSRTAKYTKYLKLNLHMQCLQGTVQCITGVIDSRN